MPRITKRNPKHLPKKYVPGFLTEMDRRSLVFKQLKSAYNEVLSDCGGKDNLSHAKRALIERFCFLEMTLQTYETLIASGEAAEDVMGKYTQAVNALQGLAKTIGLNRVPRKAKNLKQYIADTEGDDE